MEDFIGLLNDIPHPACTPHFELGYHFKAFNKIIEIDLSNGNSLHSSL